MINKEREDGGPINDGINDNTYNLLFKDYFNLSEAEQGNLSNIRALRAIELFTKLQEKKIFIKLLKLFYKNTKIDLDKISFNKEKKYYEYRSDDLIINFNLLSKCFNDKDLIKELTSNKRHGECHSRAIIISPSIEDSRIITGYVTIGNIKALHSVIEYEYDGKSIILDWTRNLRMEKEQYAALTKFVELSSFEGKKVIDDIELIAGNLTIGVKPYVVFRDEIIKDMQRNPQIFKPTEEEKMKNEKISMMNAKNNKKMK